MSKKINFRGIDIVVAENKDPLLKGLQKEYPFCYGIRHAENDWCLPTTIEKAVLANRWGYLFSNKELEFPDGEGAFLVITKEEQMLFENMEE